MQLGLLRLLSESVTQRFTYYCSGSVAWFDQSGDGHDSAITLRGDNDYEFETSKFSFQQVVHDGCRVSLVCSAFPCWKKYVEKKNPAFLNLGFLLIDDAMCNGSFHFTLHYLAI